MSKLPSDQVRMLRTYLVFCFPLLAFLSLIFAFILALNQLPGYPWFIGSTITMAALSAVTATVKKVTPRQILKLPRITVESEEAA